ncbi:flagellin [candidate division KSB1 bacterium]|nr:flagellin [candidate division KSB1 bacterium]
MGTFGDLSRIGGNIQALQSLHSLNILNKQLGMRQLRLATGKRINSAEDDAAGFVISRTLQARRKGLAVALSNVGDAKSLLSVAEGGLDSILDILETMKEKVTQAASDTLGSAERNAIDDELDALTSEIDDIVAETTFNGISLLSGKQLTVQTGAETTDTLFVTVTSADHDSAQLGVIDASIDVSSAANASIALSRINSALTTVKTSIASIGSTQARLSVKESSLSNAIINTEASRSRIADADFAKEQLESLKLQIMQQTATAALAQANSAPQIVLSLFG